MSEACLGNFRAKQDTKLDIGQAEIHWYDWCPKSCAPVVMTDTQELYKKILELSGLNSQEGIG